MKKPFWQSKGFWGALVSVGVLAWNEIGVKQFNLPPVPEAAYGVLALFGLYARATAGGPLSLTGAKPGGV